MRFYGFKYLVRIFHGIQVHNGTIQLSFELLVRLVIRTSFVKSMRTNFSAFRQNNSVSRFILKLNIVR